MREGRVASAAGTAHTQTTTAPELRTPGPAVHRIGRWMVIAETTRHGFLCRNHDCRSARAFQAGNGVPLRFQPEKAMADWLDARFYADLGELVYEEGFAENEYKEARLLHEQRFSADIWQICYAWSDGRENCESPIEEILFEKLLFAHDGYGRVEHDDGSAGYWVDRAAGEYYGTVLSQQADIGPYRVDFLFTVHVHGKSARLVVECDGHDFHEKTKEQAQRDKARDRYFVGEGIAVLRFTGSEIHRDVQACVEEIQNVLARLKIPMVDAYLRAQERAES